VSLRAAPPFAVFEGCDERLPIKDSKPAWGLMNDMGMLRHRAHSQPEPRKEVRGPSIRPTTRQLVALNFATIAVMSSCCS